MRLRRSVPDVAGIMYANGEFVRRVCRQRSTAVGLIAMSPYFALFFATNAGFPAHAGRGCMQTKVPFLRVSIQFHATAEISLAVNPT